MSKKTAYRIKYWLTMSLFLLSMSLTALLVERHMFSQFFILRTTLFVTILGTVVTLLYLAYNGPDEEDTPEVAFTKTPTEITNSFSSYEGGVSTIMSEVFEEHKNYEEK